MYVHSCHRKDLLTAPLLRLDCLSVSCSDISFPKKFLSVILAWKSSLKVPLLLLGRFCPLHYILLRDLVRCWQPTADSNGHLAPFYHAKQPLFSTEGCHTRPRKFTFKKSAPNCHYYQQRAVTLHWIGSIALWEHITAFFQGRRNPLKI